MSLTTQIERLNQTAYSATIEQHTHMLTKPEKGLADLGESLGKRLRSRPRVCYLDSVDIAQQVRVDRISNPKWKHDQLCWEAKGECSRAYKDIEVQLLKELNQLRQEYFCEMGVSLYMIGKTPESAKPIIIISSEDKRPREATRKAIITSGILKNTNFEVGVLKYLPAGPIRPIASSSSRRRSKENISDDSKGTIMYSPYQSNVPDCLSAYYDPTHQLRTTGMQVFVKTSTNQSRKATANVVSNGSKYGYITAAHVFSPWVRDYCSIDSGDDDIGIPFDSDSDDENSSTERISSAESSVLASVTAVESRASDEKNALLRKPTKQTLPGEFGSPPDLALLGHTTAIGGREKSIDCVVIAIDNSNICEKLEYLTASKSKQTIAMASAKFKPSPVTALTNHGPIQGILSDVPILMSLPGSSTFHSVYAFSYEGTIADGDCGSLVVDSVSRELYGMVLAASDKQPIAYVGGANGFLNYISDKGWRLLPVDEDYTTANRSHDELSQNDSQPTPTLQGHPEWNSEHNRYLCTIWNPKKRRYYHTHFVQGRWEFFDWLPEKPVPSSHLEPQEARQWSDLYTPTEARPAPTPSITGPIIVGTYDYANPTPNSHVELLDYAYFVRPSSFFEVGKVFSILFSEATGSDPTPYNDSVSIVKFGEYVHSRIRRFIVVSQKRGDGFCYAIPIFTYGNQATIKRGLDPSAHAIAYSMGFLPSLLRGEDKLKKEPICITMTPEEPPLSIASRIFFGVHHPIQHNVKVKDIGQVHPDHIHNLLEYWRAQDFEPDY